MKNKKKITLITGITLIILIITFIGLKFYFQPNTNIKYNQNQTFIKDNKLGDITITDINCTYDGTNSVIKYNLANKTKKDIYIGTYEVIIKNKNNETLISIATDTNYEIKSGDNFSMEHEINIDLTDAYTMEFTIIQEGDINES